MVGSSTAPLISNGSSKRTGGFTTPFLRLIISPYVLTGAAFLFLLMCFYLIVVAPAKQHVAVNQQQPFTQNVASSITNKINVASKGDDSASEPNDDGPLEYFQNTNSEAATTTTEKPIELRSDPLKPLPNEKLSDRWIVVTSIQQPTEDVKLLGSLSSLGWRVLVVGDMSSPADYANNAPEGVRFLSHDEAMTLGYNILQYQRWKTYSIKNIGYLFAIQHGAKYIYDTDDDNHPTDNLRSMLQLSGHFNESTNTRQSSIRALILNPDKKEHPLPVINTLPHFGQSSLWPRGFPLMEVARPVPRKYKICETKAPSWIQGVVNGDPDMDAIFRLTRKHFNTPINLTFDHAPPLVIPQKFFVQSNSQNTLFMEEALGLLFFPFSKAISMRETDIWRAYIGQPLLWAVGARKGYVSPNAFQARNPHDYLIDFKDEINLYKLSGELVAFLAKWECPENFDFGQCFVKLYEDLAAASLIAVQFDVDAAKAWISDLRRMSYNFPKRNSIEDCLDPKKDNREVQFYPVEQPIPLPAEAVLNRPILLTKVEKSVAELKSHVGKNASENCLLNDLTSRLIEPLIQSQIAVLTFSLVGYSGTEETAKIGTVLERLDAMYGPYVARRVYCLDSKGFKEAQAQNRGKFTLIESSSGGLDCLLQVGALRLDSEAYLLMQYQASNISLLNPSGIDVLSSFGHGQKAKDQQISVSRCDKSSGAAVIVARSSLLTSSTSLNADLVSKECEKESQIFADGSLFLSQTVAESFFRVDKESSMALPFCRFE